MTTATFMSIKLNVDGMDCNEVKIQPDSLVMWKGSKIPGSMAKK